MHVSLLKDELSGYHWENPVHALLASRCHLEAIANSAQPQTNLSMLSVAICENIFWQGYLLQEPPQGIILPQIFLVRECMMYMLMPVINVYVIARCLQ